MNTLEMYKAFQMLDMKNLLLVFICSIILSLGSFLLIRFTGKKSISQMTFPQLIIMISMGSLITKPLNANKTIIGTFLSVLIFIGVMMLLEYISMKGDKIEPFLDSTPALLVRDGKLMLDQMKKQRMTVDQLESILREKGISSFSQLRTCTLEIDGNIGYEEFKNYKPSNDNIFDELRTGKHQKKVNPKLD